ncbi:MAG: hypothetical protein SO095_01285 [Candidatus Onthovivens sp.]|nr:hypothetical protein [Candidatus Onthovivens sp.]
MLTKNAQQLRNYLMSEDIELDFMEGDDGNSLTSITQKLECGPTIKMLVMLDADDSMVRIYTRDFINGINPTKKSYIYEVLNNINTKYTYTKFVLIDDSIIIESFSMFNNNFEPSIIMDQIIGIINIAESEYVDLMKIIWS